MHCCDYYSDDVFCWFLFKDQCEPLLSDQFQIIHILIKQLIGFYFKYTVTHNWKHSMLCEGCKEANGQISGFLCQYIEIHGMVFGTKDIPRSIVTFLFTCSTSS